MIDADRAIQRTSQLRTLCKTLQETGKRLRIAQRTGGLIGSALAGVYWAHGVSRECPGHVRYFLRTASGPIFELSKDLGVSRVPALPSDATRLKDFSPVLQGPKIVALHQEQEGRGELLVALDSGHAIRLVSSFDGVRPGNSLVLETPAELAVWRDEFARDYRRLL